MEYQEFKIMIQKRVQEMVGESVEVRIESYHKNNQAKVDSLTFQEKHPASKLIFSPAVHLQDIYRLYLLKGDGKELAGCLCQIQRLYEEQEPKSVESISADWDEIKGTISINPIFKKWNQEWLREGEVPFREYLDFAIILRRTLEVTSHGMGSMVINRELISFMKVTEEEIWDAAWKNLSKEDFFIQNINDAILMKSVEKGAEMEPSDFEGMLPMYVMSNENRDYGARAILRTDLLEKFAKEMDCNLFILPSSIHEIILLPDDGRMKAGELRRDVRQINAENVAEQDRLSNEVYYFRKGADTIEIAK